MEPLEQTCPRCRGARGLQSDMPGSRPADPATPNAVRCPDCKGTGETLTGAGRYFWQFFSKHILPAVLKDTEAAIGQMKDRAKEISAKELAPLISKEIAKVIAPQVAKILAKEAVA
jgi:hypothetical protein